MQRQTLQTEIMLAKWGYLLFAFVPQSMLSHQLIANLQPSGLAKSMSQLGSSAHEMCVRYDLKP